MNRFQQQRRRGWKKPADGVIVSRPSRWGNPFPLSDFETPEECVQAFRDWITSAEPVEHREQHAYIREHVHELTGKPLGCWCKAGQPCHADVLIDMAARKKDPAATVQSLRGQT